MLHTIEFVSKITINELAAQFRYASCYSHVISFKFIHYNFNLKSNTDNNSKNTALLCDSQQKTDLSYI